MEANDSASTSTMGGLVTLHDVLKMRQVTPESNSQFLMTRDAFGQCEAMASVRVSPSRGRPRCARTAYREQRSAISRLPTLIRSGSAVDDHASCLVGG